MYKQLLSIIVLYVIFCNASFAQITIANSNMPSANDTIRYSNVSPTAAVNYDTTGAGITWDFSNLTPLNQGLFEYKSAAAVNFTYGLFFGFGSYGLKAGSYSYKPDLAKDAVLEMSMNGILLKAGDEVPKGSTINFVLGDGIGSTEVSIPNLSGLSYDEATFVLKGSGLTIGMVTFDSEHDSSSATIYRQHPTPGDDTNLKQGEAIDLFLK